MATIETSIKMTDKASPAISKISTALNKATAHCQKLNIASEKMIATSTIDKANAQLTQTSNKFAQITSNIKAADAMQQNFANGIKNTTKLTGELSQKIKGFLLAFGSIALIKKSIDFIKRSIENAQIQANAEIQLQVTLANKGAVSDAFDEIVKKAAQIQKRGMFGDEVMITGASEIAKNIKDSAAIKKMMDALSNYAISMSNGKTVDASSMKSYASGIAKALNGTYTNLERQNFKFSEAQKAVIKGAATQAQYVQVLGNKYKEMTSDMQKAAVISQVIESRVGGMYDAMSNTPTSRLNQFNNALGDISEKAGAILSPYVTDFFNNLIKYLPQIETATIGISNALNIVLDAINSLVDLSGKVTTYLQDNWNEIGVVVTTAAAALLAFAAGLNSIWIATIVVIGAIKYITDAVNKATGKSLSAIGLICGGFATLGAVVWNTIAYCWNVISIFVEWLVNIWKHPLASASIALDNLAAYILDVCADISSSFDGLATGIANTMIDAVNFTIRAWNQAIGLFNSVAGIFGVKIGTVGQIKKIESMTAVYRSDAARIRKQAESKKAADYWTAPQMNIINLDDAGMAGYNWGASLGNKINDTIKKFSLMALNQTI